MIKTKIVKVPAHEEIKEEKVCDICGHGEVMYHAIDTCSICGKDICYKCSIETDSYSKEYVSGDYAYYHICKKCWEIGLPFRNDINEVEEKAEKDSEFLVQAWKNAAKLRNK